jgi:hypothetical protein
MAATNVQAFSGDVEISSNLAVDTNTLFVDSVSGRVGIGTTNPQDITHIWKNGANGDYGLLIEQNNGGTGSATLKFGVAYTDESTAGLSKAGIFFKRADTNGRGDLLFCMDNADDTNDVDTSNHALTIYRDGNVGIGVTNPDCRLHVEVPDDISVTTKLFHTENQFSGGSVGHFEIVEKKTGAGTEWTDFTLRLQRRVDITEQGYIAFNPTGSSGQYGIAFGNGTGETMRIDGLNGRVGIGTTDPLSRATLDVRGDGMIFDKAEGDGTILSGLYNYTETQQMIDAGVAGAAGTIAASTDIAPPPGTAGDVIAKFVNTVGGEATTNTWYPGVVPIAVGTVIYFGVWIYATQNIGMEFFRFHDAGSQNVSFSYTTPNKWVWFEPTMTSTRLWNTSAFRFDNNSAGRTVYVTGLTIRVGQSQNTGLPFTPRSSPASNFGPVFTTHNLVAKEAAIKTLTGAVDVGAGLPGGGGLLITKDGYIQPGDINLAKVGINRALGGNYLFQAVYDLYRSGGQTGGTMTGIFQRYVQVIRMGSLVSIRGYSPSRQTGSTALNYRFTWAELGLDGQRSEYRVLLNYSSSTFGSWSSTVLGDSTYLTLQGTGMVNNDVNVNYNNLVYLIDVGGINSY